MKRFFIYKNVVKIKKR